jgi:hypothetical protein
MNQYFPWCKTSSLHNSIKIWQLYDIDKLLFLCFVLFCFLFLFLFPSVYPLISSSFFLFLSFLFFSVLFYFIFFLSQSTGREGYTGDGGIRIIYRTAPCSVVWRSSDRLEIRDSPISQQSSVNPMTCARVALFIKCHVPREYKVTCFFHFFFCLYIMIIINKRENEPRPSTFDFRICIFLIFVI